MSFLTLPYLGEVLYDLFGEVVMPFRTTGFTTSIPDTETDIRQYVGELRTFHQQRACYKKAYLSCLRNFPFMDSKEHYQKMGKEKFPVFFIWGETDSIVPLSCSTIAKSLIPRAEDHVIPNGGHFLFLQDPQAVQNLVSRIISSQKIPNDSHS